MFFAKFVASHPFGFLRVCCFVLYSCRPRTAALGCLAAVQTECAWREAIAGGSLPRGTVIAQYIPRWQGFRDMVPIVG